MLFLCFKHLSVIMIFMRRFIADMAVVGWWGGGKLMLADRKKYENDFSNKYYMLTMYKGSLFDFLLQP